MKSTALDDQSELCPKGILRHAAGGLFALALTVAVSMVALPSAAVAQGGPDYWAVTGVAANDTLNIRSGPDTSNRVVARAPNGSVFRNLGCRGSGNGRWCHLETPDGHLSGWAAGRFLAESGTPNTGNVSGSNEVPELHARNSGEMEVRYGSGCTALYNPVGRRINAGSSCSRSQLSAAHDAVERYQREHGASANHSNIAADPNVRLTGNGSIYGGGNATGNINGHKEGAYALIISGDGVTCTGLLRHAPGVVRTETSSLHCTNGASGTGVLAANRNGNGHTMTFTLADGMGGFVLFN